MSKGLVYILTNPCLDGWVKIGMTEKNDITKRLNQLNSPTNIPLSYRCYAVYEVENPLEVEKEIHNLIDLIDDSLHAREILNSGKIREREFFKISPETAYGIFKIIAKLRGDIKSLKLYNPTDVESKEQEFADKTSKRSNNSFDLLGISVGDQISFLYDDSIIATVNNDKNKIEYNNEIYSVTGLAIKILQENYGWAENLHINGWKYFTKDGKTLSDMRDNFENE